MININTALNQLITGTCANAKKIDRRKKKRERNPKQFDGGRTDHKPLKLRQWKLLNN